MFWSLFGVDVTDTGYFLVQQAGTARDGLGQYMSLTWLSSHLGSLWMSTPFGRHLLWIRFGWALTLSGAATFCFLTWRRFCQGSEEWYIWIIAFLAVSLFGYVRVLNSYSFGLLVLAAALFLLVRVLQGRSRWPGGEAVLFGLLLGLMPFFRFPLLFMVFAPVVVFVYARLKGSGLSGERWRMLLVYTYLGVGLSLAMAGLFLYSQGSLGMFIGVVRARVVEEFLHSQAMYKGTRYTLGGQVTMWLGVLVGLVAAVLILIVLMQLARLTHYSRGLRIQGVLRKGLFSAPVAILAAALFYLGLFHVVKLYGIAALILPLAAILVFARAHSFRFPLALREGLLFALGGMLCLVLGSDVPMERLIIGGIMLIPAVALLQCPGTEVHSLCVRSRYLQWFVGNVQRMPGVLAVVLLLIAAFLTQVCPYRDTCVWNMRASFQHPGLSGICTSPERKKVLNELLTVVSSKVREGDTILCMGKIPLVYYLTGTRPLISDPWPSYLDMALLSQEFNRTWTPRSCPRLVVIGTRSVNERDWPNTEERYLETTAAFLLLASYLERYSYVLSWENDSFQVYMKDESLSVLPGAPGARVEA
jgi:hypothetical protein